MSDATTTRLGRLYDPVRTHLQLAQDAHASWDAAVYDAYNGEHMTLAAIARASGCATSTVHGALRRETERRQVVREETQ